MQDSRRNQGLEYAYPITVGSNVWIGAGVQVMPGVTIGDNVVIGGGSVVVKDIPGLALPLGELSPQATERVLQIIKPPGSYGMVMVCPLRFRCAQPPLPRGEARLSKESWTFLSS